MKTITYKGAIFDLDGTLVDSMWIWDTVVTRWLQAHGADPDKGVAPVIKYMTFAQASGYIIDRFSLKIAPEQVSKEWAQMIIDDYRHNIALKEGVYDFVRMLKSNGVRLCVATSNFSEACEAVLRSGGIADCFDFILTSDEVGKNKSFPDIYLRSAEKMRLTPKDCMVFEDILPAVLTAKKAGFQTTAVYDADSAEESEQIKKTADRYILSFDALL